MTWLPELVLFWTRTTNHPARPRNELIMNSPTSIPITLADVPVREMVPGFEARFIHTDAMTFAYWAIQESSELPEHSHMHQQVVNMLEGEFELVVDGTPHHLKPGDVLVIPRDVVHSGRAITDCRILDVFQPARDDYRLN